MKDSVARGYAGFDYNHLVGEEKGRGLCFGG